MGYLVLCSDQFILDGILKLSSHIECGHGKLLIQNHLFLHIFLNKKDKIVNYDEHRYCKKFTVRIDNC